MQKKQGNIKVFCRFRPFNKKQLQCHSQKLHRIANKTQLIIKDLKGEKADEMSFMYDHVFDVDSTQQQVFQQVGLPVLKNIIDGFNGTIMAYGQTSSGKTHTMQGYDLNDKDIKGIMPRIIEKLFSAIQKSIQSFQYKLKISIFQLYLQKIRDLLDVSKNDLKIRQNKAGPYIENLTQVYVGDKSQLFKLINLGQKNRITCATNMNQHSSRSHMIFLLSLNQFNNHDSSSKTSKLYLIDLAGSQKVSKTGAQGKVLQQAKKINLSLTNLGKVIKNLAQRNSHVPYRDSKLTRVLKDSLGGNSKTTLIVTCSPHQTHLPETISTLRFGQNAQKIKNKPKINRELTVQQLQKIVEKLQQQAKIKDAKILLLQKYIKQTLKSDLPDYSSIAGYLKALQIGDNGKYSFAQNKKQSEQYKQSGMSQQVIQSVEVNNQNLQSSQKQLVNHNQQQSYYLSRITQLQKQLEAVNDRMANQCQKYYQLKKQYNELHENLTSILKENIQFQQQKNKYQNIKFQLQQKILALEYKIAMKQSLAQHDKRESIKQCHKQNQQGKQQNSSLYQNQLQNKLIQNNSPLIKMIIGQIFSIIGPYQQQEIIKVIQNDHWFKKIMIDGVNCVDFYQFQKDKMNQHIRQFVHKKQTLQKNIQQEINQKLKISDSKNIAFIQQQNKLQKQRQNQKIIVLQNKLDKLFDQYHQMISLQTTWKAQCQLYERKLKKKQQKIQELQEMLQQLSQQIKYLEGNIYDDFQDSISVKSKIVKPLKGGFLFK